MKFKILSIVFLRGFQVAFLLLFSIHIKADTKRALFLGNSYTYVNDLPQMIADVAKSTGDTLLFDSNTPGGQSLGGHLADPVSINKIKAGGFDFVMLQEQSMRPSFPDDWVIGDFLLNAYRLDSVINLYNPCGETMFYMTWGYRDGNPGYCSAYPWWPYECTYEAMDSLTNLRYCMAADSNDGVVSPVGAVRHYLRDHYPSIELYDSDGSHPSLAGTYAAACCFNTAIFRTDPYLVTFAPALDAATINAVKEATKAIVFDSLLKWHIGEYDNLLPDSCGGHISLNELVIFPNPAGNGMTVRLPGNLVNAEVTVYNSTGSVVNRIEKISGKYLRISTTDLPGGVYFLRLSDQGSTLATGKVIVP
jgi:hypothetical protein